VYLTDDNDVGERELGPEVVADITIELLILTPSFIEQD